jgi:hypothetical protein
MQQNVINSTDLTCLFYFLAVLRFELMGLMLAREILYQLSHSVSPF